MRLIDADELSKLVGEPIEVFLRRLDLKLPPIVDAVEVVRCKECKHYRTRWVGFCELIGNENIQRENDDYCSEGERREDEIDRC